MQKRFPAKLTQATEARFSLIPTNGRAILFHLQ